MNKDILEIARYVISNHATINEVCEHFQISRKTAQKYTGEYLEKICSENEDYKDLYESVQMIKQTNQCKSSKNINLEDVVINIINNKLSNEVACKKYNISESTLLNYIRSLPEDCKLKNEYKKTKEELIKIGNFVGGTYSIRDANITDFEACEIAEDMIKNDLTIDEASFKFNVPRSTLYESIRRVDDDDIQSQLNELFDRRKKR